MEGDNLQLVAYFCEACELKNDFYTFRELKEDG